MHPNQDDIFLRESRYAWWKAPSSQDSDRQSSCHPCFKPLSQMPLVTALLWRHSTHAPLNRWQNHGSECWQPISGLLAARSTCRMTYPHLCPNCASARKLSQVAKAQNKIGLLWLRVHCAKKPRCPACPRCGIPTHVACFQKPKQLRGSGHHAQSKWGTAHHNSLGMPPVLPTRGAVGCLSKVKGQECLGSRKSKDVPGDFLLLHCQP